MSSAKDIAASLRSHGELHAADAVDALLCPWCNGNGMVWNGGEGYESCGQCGGLGLGGPDLPDDLQARMSRWTQAPGDDRRQGHDNDVESLRICQARMARRTGRSELAGGRR